MAWDDIWSEELLEQADDEIDRLRSENEDLAERIDELMDEIDELKKHEWISVKDRLPELGSYVLVFTNDYCDYTAHYDGYWWLSGEEPTLSYEVTHWMPLPAPPEVEDAID